MREGACGRGACTYLCFCSLRASPPKVAASISEQCVTAHMNFVYQLSDEPRGSDWLAVRDELRGGVTRVEEHWWE